MGEEKREIRELSEIEFDILLKGLSPQKAMNLRAKRQLYNWIDALEIEFNNHLKNIREFIDLVEWERLESD